MRAKSTPLSRLPLPKLPLSKLTPSNLLLLLLTLPLALPLAQPVLAQDGTAMAPETRLLRQPDVHGNLVTFVYAGDIWLVDTSVDSPEGTDGYVARRLTSDDGMELFPKFSPDGTQIAFSGEYAGNRQVYVLPVTGGMPTQLTWYNDVGPLPPRGGWDNRILDWTPDGESILFRANRVPWGERMGRPYLVPAKGGLERPLPITESGAAMFSPDGKQLVFTPIEREFRTWKRYRGGRQQDVWTFDLESGDARQLTDDLANDNQPLWVGDWIFFTSDRRTPDDPVDGDTANDTRLNLYALDPASGATHQITDHQDFDVLWPSAGPDSIVYEAGGRIYRIQNVVEELTTQLQNEPRKPVIVRPQGSEPSHLLIRIVDDFHSRLPYIANVGDAITDAELSPSGARALLTARGDVFTVPAEHGEIRNLTATPGIREMDASWSPDGRWVAYLSDKSGEYEIYLRAHDSAPGPEAERAVTSDGDTWRFAPVWSPDSKKLAFADKKQRLRYVDVESGTVVEIDTTRYDDFDNVAWSPDSLWLAYDKENDADHRSIYAYSLERAEVLRLTGDMTDDSEPVFDPEGRYLYFLSNRDFNLTFSDHEFNYLYTDATRVYAAQLNTDAPPLFYPKSDEEPVADASQAEPEADKSASADTAANENAAPKITLDAEGFETRVLALPGAPGDYGALSANADGPIYLANTGDGFQLRRYDLQAEEEQTLFSSLVTYRLSASGDKLIYRQGGTVGIVDVAKNLNVGDGRLDLSHLEMRIDPAAEWHQIFVDGWRLLRDWFWHPDMHGMDWQQVRARYEPLVDHVAHRADLDFILGEVAGELNSGHVYVNPGDQPEVERRDTGLLGAELVTDPSGYFRIGKIFSGENWHDDWRSPLTQPGVDVREGDLILAIDGVDTRGVANPYQLLENKAERVVTLRIAASPDATAREARVHTLSSEGNLRYLDWIEERRRRVSEASDGRIGYVHVPNTSQRGNHMLFKYFYPQVQKDALIFDLRYNGGGFIPDRMVELISRPRLNYWKRRGLEIEPWPGVSHDGPKACLINGYSSSGGDAFPFYFRKLDLGPLIGTRTWGGLIGTSANPGLVDGGSISIAAFRFMDSDGSWAVENEGVSPDIEVVDRPDATARGEDPSLERAIQELLQQLETNPRQPVNVPPAPERFP